jgi:hypothetical protein
VVEPAKKVVPRLAVVGGEGLTVVGVPEGAALLLSLIWAPPGRFCWSEVWNTPDAGLKDS